MHKDFLYQALQPILFRQDPETIHEHTLNLLHHISQIPVAGKIIEHVYHCENSALQVQLWNKTFPNPVGVAAGFDKEGKAFNPLFALGFGFVEIGTVTPLAQPGNPKPRIFRLPEDHSLINRLGFNNQGVAALVSQVKNNPPDGILGINIGKNKTTANDSAVDDYETALRAVYDHAGYIVINVSSPNTEKLRALQEQEALHKLIDRLFIIRKELVMQGQPHKTLLLKIAPDLTDETFHDIITIIHEFKLDGVIATNTTLTRNDLRSPSHTENGGLSGAALRTRSTKIIGKLYQEFGSELPLIGVGGVFSGKDAYDKIRAGASMVQVYTGLIYRGPAIAKFIKQELLQQLEQDGFSSISDAVGADFR
ncbi:MAG: quinone-dependent dihydroorotate dehydrogenase [SAR324 cluster bacterium]|nr:quinone-dependent dihydroorotate dehydrogenase [SAR324 cluster bacterium]